MKALPKKEGKLGFLGLFGHAVRLASMKVPPKDGKGAAIAFVVVKGMPQ